MYAIFSKNSKLFAAGALLIGLFACGGGGGDKNTGTTPPPEPDPDAFGDNEFRFTGLAPGAGPDATVTVEIDGKQYAGTTDSQEAFKIDLPLTHLDQEAVVRVTARGAGTREHIELQVAVPDARRLRALAGDDRILDTGEFVDATLSEVAVGRYARMVVANGGAHITDPDRFRSLQRDLVDGNDVLLSGAALYTVSSGQQTLPAEAKTVWQMLSDETLFDGFVKDARAETATTKSSSVITRKTSSDPFRPAVLNLLEDHEPFTVADLPTSYLLTEISRSTLDLKGGLLEFNDDGTGTHVTAAGSNTMAWSINAEGELIIVPAPGKVAEFVTLAELLINSANLQVRQQEMVGEVVLRKLRSSDYADLLTMEYRVAESVPGDTSGFWPQTGVFLKAVTAVKPDGHDAFAAEELAGTTWAMPGIAMGVTQTMAQPAQQTVPTSVHIKDEGPIALQIRRDPISPQHRTAYTSALCARHFACDLNIRRQ